MHGAPVGADAGAESGAGRAALSGPAPRAAAPLRLLQLVPQLPPAIDGVGDYAARLGAALGAAHGVAPAYLVTTAGWRASAGAPGPAAGLARHDAAALLAGCAALLDGQPSTGGEALLVHWSNYGYQRRGCPWWLVRALGRLRAARPALRVVTMFHELYDAGAPLRSSAFWLAPWQRRLAAQTARLSDTCATNTVRHRDLLAAWSGRAPAEVALLPVFSNIGEPAEVPAFAARASELVVFGGAGSRRRVYARAPGALAAACRALGVVAVHDVGPQPQEMPTAVAGLPVARHGALPAAALGALLLRVRYGALDYPRDLLGKSGIHAAYASHGVVPVMTRPEPRGPLAADPALLDAAALAGAAARAPECAARALAAYRGHDLAAQAACFAGLLGAARAGSVAP